jgi:hypothetical protein
MRHEQARYYFDNSGKFVDCYTVVYSKGIKLAPFHISYPYATMSEHPTAPDGVWQHGTQQTLPIDNWGGHYADYKHLGHRIKFSELPEEVQNALIREANQ